MEHFTLSLRGLRYRYDTVIRGGAPEAIDHHPSAIHPLEVSPPARPGASTGSGTKDGLEPETVGLVMST